MSDRVALVTGGGRGLGRAFAQRLASEGVSVAVAAQTESQVNETAELIESDGGAALSFVADVSEDTVVKKMVSDIEQRLGPVSLLVNNAGIYGPVGPEWDVDISDWRRCLEVNLLGPVNCTHAVLPGMIERKQGRIINLSSMAASTQKAYASAYSTSKAALAQYTNCIAGSLRRFGISVFAYHPGTVRTSMTEYLARSEVVREWGGRFHLLLEQGKDMPIGRAVDVLMFLASGRADGLTGRFITAQDSPEKLAEQSEEIEKKDLYTLRRRTL